MRTVLYLIAALTACLSLPARAQTPCAAFEIVGAGLTASYNPFDTANVAVNFQIKVVRLTGGVQSIRFILVDPTPVTGGPGLGANGPKIYDVRWVPDATRNVLVWTGQPVTAANSASVPVSGGGGAVVTTNFQLTLPRGQAVSAGSFTENLDVRYQCIRGGTADPQLEQIGSGAMRLTLNVPQYAAAYIGSAGQTRGTIAFGTLSPDTSNLSKTIAITALSTLPYEIKLSSDNGGKLKRSAGASDGIGYTTRYAGRALAAGQPLICPATPAPSGRVSELEVTLDGSAIGTLPAGSYRDVLTLTFSPRDGGLAQIC